MRQALAGMLWSKQTYYFDVDLWLRERQSHPLRSPLSRGTRNESWFHMVNHDVISMPDKWEYPWYAAWDLAFHCSPRDGRPRLRQGPARPHAVAELYLHPSGQIPAYEWNFGDVNPPVHAFATLSSYTTRAGTARRRDRPGVPRECVPQAAAQLHVVGQPQGPERPQRVRGRVPRPRQHRRVRPQRAAAHRRQPRAGRRHRVDGAVQPEHARAGARPRRARPRPTRTSC